MKKICFLIICIFVIILGTIGIKYKNTPEKKQTLKNDEIVEKQNKDIDTKEVKETIEIKEQDENTIVEEKKEEVKTSQKTNSSNTTSNKQFSSETKKTETKTESSSSTNTTVTKTEEPKVETKPVEEKKEEPKKEETKKYIGVPSPNTYNYSFHHGKIEYATIDACVNDSYRIMEKDVVDIYGSWCSEVQDDNGTVLGAYLYIKCTSGNCDKYKD